MQIVALISCSKLYYRHLKSTVKHLLFEFYLNKILFQLALVSMHILIEIQK